MIGMCNCDGACIDFPPPPLSGYPAYPASTRRSYQRVQQVLPSTTEGPKEPNSKPKASQARPPVQIHAPLSPSANVDNHSEGARVAHARLGALSTASSLRPQTFVDGKIAVRAMELGGDPAGGAVQCPLPARASRPQQPVAPSSPSRWSERGRSREVDSTHRAPTNASAQRSPTRAKTRRASDSTKNIHVCETKHGVTLSVTLEVRKYS